MGWRAHIARCGDGLLPGEPWARRAFLVLLALAAVLRFRDLPNIPYTHDEISALVRIYPTLGETIQRGVIELDTHPPGVQVFEWAWTRLFGMGEAAVKLPFILMGLAALLLLYRFALAWTGATPALLLMALLSTLQYAVAYAQIARPYAVGLFTTALMADQLTRYLACGRRRALLGIGLAAVLGAYTHHFALLMAGTIGLTGLLLVAPERRKAYLLMCGAAVLLYLPNVPILLRQLGTGGLGGWLAPPDRHWVTDYAWWVAHCSPVLALLLGALLALALARRVRNGGSAGPARWFLPLWGLLPLVVGLAYSVWREPVVQYSMLLFSFPYLVLALFTGLGSLGARWTLAIVAAVAAVSTATLITERRHYELFYASKYEAMVRNGQAALEEHGPDGAAVLIDAADEAIGFHLRQWGIAPEAFPFDQLRGTGFTPARLDSLLERWQGRTIAYGETDAAPPEQLARIQRHFPVMLERHDLYEGQVFRFAAGNEREGVQDRRTIALAKPDGPPMGTWEGLAGMPLAPGDEQAVWDYGGREYGVLLRIGLDTVVRHPLDVLEVMAELEPGTGARDVGLVLELRRGDNTVFYRTDELERARVTDGRAMLIVAARPVDAGWRKGPLELRAYLHNREQAPLRVRSIHAKLREGNHWRYGLFQDIPSAPLYP